MRKPEQRQMLSLQMIVIFTVLVSPAVQAFEADGKCKCFMCVCDFDPHPLPPELPSHHHPPPPAEPEHIIPPPPPAVPEEHHYPPPVEHEPAPGYYYYPPPYGYPWVGLPYQPPVGEMYPRDKAAKSGAHRNLGHGASRSLLAAGVLASVMLPLLMRSA